MPMNNRLLRPRQTGFDPRSIPGLQLWIDASVSSSVTLNSGNVSLINDLSGNGRHLEQTTAATQPAYLTSGRNGRNVIDFGTTNGKWLRQTLASRMTVAQPLTFFWVFKTPVTGGYTLSDVTNVALDGTGRIIMYGNAANEMRFEAGVANAVNQTADAWHVVTCVFNQAASERRINTKTSTTISVGTRPYSDQLIVGASFGVASGFRSLLGEMGFYSGALTSSQNGDLMDYLAKKWAVTLL